jgi:hypothetical protein
MTNYEGFLIMQVTVGVDFMQKVMYEWHWHTLKKIVMKKKQIQNKR